VAILAVLFALLVGAWTDLPPLSGFAADMIGRFAGTFFMEICSTAALRWRYASIILMILLTVVAYLHGRVSCLLFDNWHNSFVSVIFHYFFALSVAGLRDHEGCSLVIMAAGRAVFGNYMGPEFQPRMLLTFSRTLLTLFRRHNHHFLYLAI